MLQQVLAVLVILVCAWAVLSPHVPTGTIITLGLGMIALACLSVIDDKASSYRTVTTLLCGVLTVAGGMLWRGRKARRGAAPGTPRRRATDFGALDEGEHA